jgi:hypothetical protein
MGLVMIEIVLMSDISYMSGIIGLAEYRERLLVAKWLSNDEEEGVDPREPFAEPNEDVNDKNDVETPRQGDGSAASANSAGGNDNNETRWPRFLLLNKWHFTIGDVDCVPSVPHGHENSKTQSWPKLNPYTGKVYIGVEREDVSRRLNRNDMKKIWTNKKFLEECRKQIVWYAENFPSYQFRNARRGRDCLPKW